MYVVLTVSVKEIFLVFMKFRFGINTQHFFKFPREIFLISLFIKIAMVVESGENLIGYLRNKNSGFKLEKKKRNRTKV